MSFKEQYVEFQRIVGELKRLRDHNVSFDADSLELFFMAEGVMVLLALERFLRMILGAEARETDTLLPLLEKATSTRLDLLVLPGQLGRDETMRRITVVRNTLMHGNYEQAAKTSGSPSKEDYFRSGRYISEVELFYRVLNRIIKQINPDTGRPRPRNHPEMQTFLASPDFLDLRHAAADEASSPSRLVRATHSDAAPRLIRGD